MFPDVSRKADHTELSHQAKHVPVMSVGLAVERDVVDPHVEIRPINSNEEHQARQPCIPPRERENEADADGNFHHARDEHPDGGVAQDGGNDGLKPGGIGEVLNAYIDVHSPKENCGQHHHQIETHIIPLTSPEEFRA